MVCRKGKTVVSFNVLAYHLKKPFKLNGLLALDEAGGFYVGLKGIKINTKTWHLPAQHKASYENGYGLAVAIWQQGQ